MDCVATFMSATGQVELLPDKRPQGKTTPIFSYTMTVNGAKIEVTDLPKRQGKKTSGRPVIMLGGRFIPNHLVRHYFSASASVSASRAVLLSADGSILILEANKPLGPLDTS